MAIPARAGFVDPAYMIFITAAGIGVALVVPGLEPFFRGEPATLWNWIELGAGTALLVGCAIWYARWK